MPPWSVADGIDSAEPIPYRFFEQACAVRQLRRSERIAEKTRKVSSTRSMETESMDAADAEVDAEDPNHEARSRKTSFVGLQRSALEKTVSLARRRTSRLMEDRHPNASRSQKKSG